MLREEYFPTFWCWESRLQSLVSTFVRNLLISDIQYRRQVFTFSDGGEVGLDWATTDHHQSPHQPIVLILPGEAGREKYFFYEKNNFQESPAVLSPSMSSPW